MERQKKQSDGRRHIPTERDGVRHRDKRKRVSENTERYREQKTGRC